ncbi:Rieske domain-containing protein-like isoform X1 [Ptychodera flava]|uniref:Rieske domain-containing protein-like isoform X1 n=1 Tax=Ptychodera flava TaxID=63121 RepID=UPI003969C55B
MPEDEHASTVVNSDDAFYFSVDNVHFEELYDWADAKQKCRMHSVTGKKVRRQSSTAAGHCISLNGQKIAIFRHGDKVYAINEKCPHAGGPLHMGDIEDMPGKSLCVKCPWHSWRFELDTGKVQHPKDRGVTAVVYPTKVDTDGNIYISFEQFSPHFFQSEDF